MSIVQRPSPNQDDRGGAPIDMLVLHYTGMRTAEEALARLCDPTAKVSAQEPDGGAGFGADDAIGRADVAVYAHVPEARRAWHAGISHWAGATDINARSIGIEVVNPGHEFGYRAFAEAQIAALIPLCQGIVARHAIPAARVLAHSDVAPARKEDPGELFPWQRLADAGIGLWPRGLASDLGPEALCRFGYDPAAPQSRVITAFQRHFRPARLDGEWDSESAGLLASLLRQAGV